MAELAGLSVEISATTALLKRQIDDAEKRVREFERRANASADSIDSRSAKLGGGYDRAAKMMRVANDNMARSAASTEAAMRRLMPQLTDVFQSMASGSNIMMVLAQQGPEIAGAFGRITPFAMGLGLAFATAAMAAGKLASEAIRSGDAMTQAEGRLRAATGSIGAARDVYDQLYQIALLTGTAVSESAGQFVRFRIAGNAIGATNAEVVQLVETVQKFGIVSGASTSEAQAGAMQLAQALASGKLQGDELRSILENMPTLAQAIAQELGVPIGKLREMGEAGELSADRIFQAILKAKEQADAQFGQMPMTVERASNIMAASWDRFTAEIDRSLGLSQKLAASIQSVAGWLNQLTDGMTAAPGRTADRLEARIAETRRELEEMRRHPEAYTAEIAAREKLLTSFEAEIEGLRELQLQESRIAAQRQLRERQTQATAKAEAASTAILSGYKETLKDLHPEEEARKKRDEARVNIMAALDAGLISFTQAHKDLAAVEREYQEALKKGNDSLKGRGKASDDAKDAADALRDSIREEADILKEADRIRRSVMTPMERYAEEQARLNELLDQGYISQDTYNRALAAADPAYREAQQAAADYQREVDRAVSGTTDRVVDYAGDAFADLFADTKGGWEEVWDDMGRIARQTLARIAAEAIIRPVVQPIVAEIVGSAPSLFGIGGSGQSGAAAGQGGGVGLGSLSNLGSLFNTGPSSALYGVGSWLATSSLGQALGLSSAAGGAAHAAGVAATAGGLTNAAVPVLTSAGGAFASGLAASPWGIIGSLGANLLGLGGGIGGTIGGLVGSIGGGIAGSSIGTILGMAGGPVGAVLGAFLGTALGGLFGGKKEYPVAAGAVQFQGGEQVYRNAATDNGGDPEAAQQLVDALSAATATLLEVGNLTQKSAFALGLESKNGSFRAFDPTGGSPDLGSFATADEAVIAAYRKALADGVFEAGATVGKAIRGSTAKELEPFLRQVDLAGRIEAGNTALSDLATTLAQVQKNAKTATLEGLEPLSDDLELAKGAGIEAEYKDLLTRQFATIFSTQEVDFTAYELAVAQARGRAEAYKQTIKDLGLAMQESAVDAKLAADIARLQQQAQKDINAAINDANGNGFLNQLKAVGETYDTTARNLKALGLATTGASDLFTAQARQVLSGLDEAQLDTVIANFDGEIETLAISLRDAAKAAREAAAAVVLEDAQRAGLVAIEQAINPGWQPNADVALSALHVAPAAIIALRNSINGLMTEAAAGTASAQDLRDAEATVRAQLTSGAITAEQYTSIIGMLTQAYQNSGTAAQAAAQAVAASEAAIARIRTENAQAAIQALQEQVSAQEQIASRWASIETSVRNTRLGLLTGDLSPLDPQRRLAEARRQAEEAVIAARAGDEDAADRAPELVRAFLEASRSFNASSAAYVSDFDWGQDALEGLETEAQRQARTANDQLAVLRKQLATQQATLQALQQPSQTDLAPILSGLNAGNLGDMVTWARRQGPDTLQAVLATADQRLGWQNNPYRYGSPQDVQAIVSRMTVDQLVGLARPLGFTGAIADLNPWLAAREDKRAAWEAAVRASGYAAGTPSAVPGWAWVGERGPELMPFGGGEPVIPHPAAVSMASAWEQAASSWLRPANDRWSGPAPSRPANDAAAEEVKALRADVQRLNATVQHLVRVAADGASQTVGAIKTGNALQADMASAARRRVAGG